jgi:hypothetical protein
VIIKLNLSLKEERGHGIMEKCDGKIGKKILIVFEDGQNKDGSMHISTKEGICTCESNIEIAIDSKHFIPRSRIIRLEVRE